MSGKRGSHLLTVENLDKFLIGDYVKLSLYSGRKDGKYNSDLSKLLTYPLLPEPEWKNYSKYSPC